MQTAAQPLAQLLDAQVAAHHAGVDETDVALLMEIGEDIATFALALKIKCDRLKSGAAGTNECNPTGPEKHPYEFDDPPAFASLLVSVFDEDCYGYSLDNAAVIAAACNVRLAAAEERRQTATAPRLTPDEIRSAAEATGVFSQFDALLSGEPDDYGPTGNVSRRLKSGDYYARLTAGKRVSAAYRDAASAFVLSQRQAFAARYRKAAAILGFAIVDITGELVGFERPADPARDLGLPVAA